MPNIAVPDNTAMNILYRAELSRIGAKIAAGEDPQAFKDHDEYEKTLESVLNSDGKESWEPNDKILD